jgi:hypothetical protein
MLIFNLCALLLAVSWGHKAMEMVRKQYKELEINANKYDVKLKVLFLNF